MSILNSTQTLQGLQLGLFNGSFEFASSDLSHESEVHGLQLGAVNFADGSVHGLQIGLVNLAETLHGVQLGLLNIARSSDYPCLPLLRIAF
ncbi:MAG: hypothetical protein ILO10_00020 [Kiritimatiellae bacterium]|nr:hypothetical protein [Kiritimatiellia bacterium]